MCEYITLIFEILTNIQEPNSQENMVTKMCPLWLKSLSHLRKLVLQVIT